MFSLEGFFGCAYSLDFVFQDIARALSLSLTFEKAPGPSEIEGTCRILGGWRFTWVAERQVCSVRSFYCFIILSPLVLLIIDLAGRAVPARLGIYTGWIRIRSFVWIRTARNWRTPLRLRVESSLHLGKATVLPVRGHLDSIKRLLKGDLHIGRGSRQRSLAKSRYCNTFKGAQYGRSAAIAGFREVLLSDQQLYDSL